MKIDLNDAKRLGWRAVWGTVLLAALPASIGCQQKPEQAAHEAELKANDGSQFLSDEEPRAMHRIAEAQAARGARRDATLHTAHFDDGGNPAALNSLGEEKLDLMLADDAALPLVVYVDAPADDASAGREQSVRVYLKDRGLGEAQVQVVAGPNVRRFQPVAPLVTAAHAAGGNPQAGSTPNGGASNGGMTAK
jgi:hypothetical protein